MSENYERFSYPCISKPRNGRGSRLVFEHLNPQSVKLYINSLNNVNLDDFILQEKIVIKEVEVPKEIETLRKEMVYVPLPTDDESLLKKGPISAPDYDKNKKK